MSEQMYESGYRKITNIDISEVVIKKMIDVYNKKEQDMMCNST